MKLHIEHETNFIYQQPVREAIDEAKLRPREDSGWVRLPTHRKNMS